MTSTPPVLLSISQCDTSLEFQAQSHWPATLPGVALNRLVLVGFHRDLVLNHDIATSDESAIVNLVTAVYPSLSFVEAADFARAAARFEWLPVGAILQRWGFRDSENFRSLTDRVAQLPIGMRDWLREKRVSPQELQILQSAGSLNLNPLFHNLLGRSPSRQQGVQILELSIELMLMQKAPGEIAPGAEEPTDEWVSRLRALRHPETFKRDDKAREWTKQIHWPGQSQVRWVRQGDRAGLELKLFVANPTDLKKSLSSLQQIQTWLEENQDGPWQQ